MTFQPVVTADGSLSCRDTTTGELCHNSAGAYKEAVTNYVTPSNLLGRLKNQGLIRVLDACYGLGYNTWALINEFVQSDILQAVATSADTHGLTISVVAIEQSLEVLQFMPRILEHSTFDALKKITGLQEHNIDYRTLECFSDTKEGQDYPHKTVINVAEGVQIELELWVEDLRIMLPRLAPGFDAVFHDPFSPQKMPELWTVDLFQEYFRLLAPQKGCLLTYSAAAAVRGGLQEAGFSIAKTQGLGAKGGGTMAIAGPIDGLGKASLPFDEWELEYLLSRAGIPYRDAGLQQTRATILEARQTEQANSERPPGGASLKKKSAKRLQLPN